jgi:hypothetical protein
LFNMILTVVIVVTIVTKTHIVEVFNDCCGSHRSYHRYQEPYC